ncbi:MAG TPA: hypothetical protein VGM84_27680 [Steroidobacteraceae bacterium]
MQIDNVVRLDDWHRVMSDRPRTAAFYADEAGERELAARIGRDDHVALIFLFSMYYSRLAGVFSRLLATWDPETVRMHIQAAAVTAWQTRRSLVEAESVHAWMMALALRQVRRSLQSAASVSGRASHQDGDSPYSDCTD